jgi:hypothetical protein
VQAGRWDMAHGESRRVTITAAPWLLARFDGELQGSDRRAPAWFVRMSLSAHVPPRGQRICILGAHAKP